MLDVHIRLALESPDRRFEIDAAFQSQAARTALLGPSGSGKSTVLLAIAGLLPGASGHVRVGDSVLFDSANGIDLPARRRGIGFVFQDYALFPHLSVEENLLFGVRRLGARLGDPQRRRVDALLHQFELEPLRRARPRHLSGGQRQRAALARALASSRGCCCSTSPCRLSTSTCAPACARSWPPCWSGCRCRPCLVSHDPQDVAALAQTVVRLDNGRVRPPDPGAP